MSMYTNKEFETTVLSLKLQVRLLLEKLEKSVERIETLEDTVNKLSSLLVKAEVFPAKEVTHNFSTQKTLTDVVKKVQETKPDWGRNTVLKKCREEIGILSNNKDTWNLPNVLHTGWTADMYVVSKQSKKLLLTQVGFDFMVNQILNYDSTKYTGVPSVSNVIDFASMRNKLRLV